MNLRSLVLGSLLVAVSTLCADPLARDATVYARPDPSATVLKILPAGTNPTPAAHPTEPAPTGWLAVEIPGPHELYIENKDVAKNLDVKPGSFFYLRPERHAPVVATMQPSDRAELANLAGDYTSYIVDRPIVGFIKLGHAVATVPAAPTRPAVTVASPVATGEIGRAAMPRFFEGRLAATQNFIAYKHPYNFQLLDPAGNRFAYLDISHLLLTDKIELFLDRVVVVYGTVRTLNQEGSKRVIEVESLHLK